MRQSDGVFLSKWAALDLNDRPDSRVRWEGLGGVRWGSGEVWVVDQGFGVSYQPELRLTWVRGVDLRKGHKEKCLVQTPWAGMSSSAAALNCCHCYSKSLCLNHWRDTHTHTHTSVEHERPISSSNLRTGRLRESPLLQDRRRERKKLRGAQRAFIIRQGNKNRPNASINQQSRNEQDYTWVH